MISMAEILKGKDINDVQEEHQTNLFELLIKCNKLRELYAKAMIVSSGYRSLEEHIRIYADKGIRDLSKIPMKSKHLSGQACDFADPDNHLKDFINDHLDEVAAIGLWFEDFKHTPGWVHVQIIPPASGRRFFIP
jgi:uncharacterized protein YcbK (DUF882 family)